MSAGVSFGAGGERVVRLEGRDVRRVLAASTDDMQDAIRYSGLMRHLDRLARRGDLHGDRYMTAAGAAGYIVNTGTSALALSAATAKTVWYVNGGSAKVASFCEFAIAFDGVTAANVPALVEMVYGTKASNSTPGTGSTSFTPVQVRGWGSGAAAAAAANACSSEPTVLTVTRTWLVSPNGGLLLVQFPLSREPTTLTTASTSGLQIGLRANAPNAVNIRSYAEIEE